MKPVIGLILFSFYFASKTSAAEYVSFLGDDQEFTCQGNNVKWFTPNGNEISSDAKYVIKYGSKESTLKVKSVSPADEGKFKCEGDKEKAEDFDLKLFRRQSVTQNVKSFVVNECGGKFNFICDSDGVPAPTAVYWYFDEVLLYSRRHLNISGNSLTINKVRPEQEGEYSCVVEQKLKDTRIFQEKLFQLVVVDEDSSYQMPKVETVQENGNVTLTCDSETGAENYHWKHEKFYVVDEKKEKKTTRSIVLKNIQAEDAGKYTCYKNFGVLTRTFLVEVEHAPILKNFDEETVKAGVGSKVELECAADGNPTPAFQWFYEGQEFFNNIKSFNSVSRATIKVEKDSYGKYTCKVSNYVGYKEKVFDLTK